MARRIVGWCFVAAVFVVPLAHALGLRDQTELPKRALAAVAVGLIWAAWTVVAPDARAPRRPRSGPLPWLFAFTLWQLWIAPFAYAPTQAIEPVVTAAVTLGFFALATDLMAVTAWRRAALAALVAAGVVAAVVGLLQYAVAHPGAFPFRGPTPEWLAAWQRGEWADARPGERPPWWDGLFSGRLAQNDVPASVFGHTNVAAQFVMVALIVAASAGASRLVKGWRRRSLPLMMRGCCCAIAAIPCALFIVRSGSRGVFLAVLAVGVIAWCLFVVRTARTRPLFGTAGMHVVVHGMLVMVLAAGLVAGLSHLQSNPRHGQEQVSAWTRLQSALDARNTTVRERLDLWANTAAMVAAHPVFGVGPGNFKVVYPEFSSVRRRHEIGRLTATRQPEKPHNSYLGFLAENGVGALFLFVAIILALRDGFRAAAGGGEWGMVAAMLAICLTAVVSFPFVGTATRLSFWLLAAAAIGSRVAPLDLIAARRSGPRRALAWSFVALLVVGVCAARYRARLEASRSMAAAMGNVAMSTVPTAGRERLLLQALRHVDQAARRMPAMYVYEHYRGEVLRQMGRLADAEASFHRALRLHPNLINALTGLASIQLEMGRDREALVNARRAVRLNRHEPNACITLAVARERVGDVDGAIADYVRALRSRPDRTAKIKAHVNLALLLDARGDVLGASWHLQRAAEIAPSSPVVIAAQARVLERHAPRSRAALAAWQRLMAADPNHAEARLRVGMGHLAAGEPELALALFDDAFTKAPHRPDILFQRSLALRALGRFQEARDSLYECMQLCGKVGRMDLWEQCWRLGTELDEQLAATREKSAKR